MIWTRDGVEFSDKHIVTASFRARLESWSYWTETSRKCPRFFCWRIGCKSSRLASWNRRKVSASSNSQVDWTNSKTNRWPSSSTNRIQVHSRIIPQQVLFDFFDALSLIAPVWVIPIPLVTILHSDGPFVTIQGRIIGFSSLSSSWYFSWFIRVNWSPVVCAYSSLLIGHPHLSFFLNLLSPYEHVTKRFRAQVVSFIFSRLNWRFKVERHGGWGWGWVGAKQKGQTFSSNIDI